MAKREINLKVDLKTTAECVSCGYKGTQEKKRHSIGTVVDPNGLPGMLGTLFGNAWQVWTVQEGQMFLQHNKRNCDQKVEYHPNTAGVRTKIIAFVREQMHLTQTQINEAVTEWDQEREKWKNRVQQS